MTSYVPYPQTATYFGTQPRTATVRSLGNNTLAVSAVSVPGSWTIDLPVDLTKVAAVTLQNGAIVPVAELQSIATNVAGSTLGLLVRGFDRNTGAIAFTVDSQNSALSGSNDNPTFRGMRVVLKDLRFGPSLGAVDEYDATVSYGTGALVFLAYGRAYISLHAANVGNTPFAGSSHWAIHDFKAGDRLAYTRTLVYNFAAIKDGALVSPIPPTYNGASTYTGVGFRVFYGDVIWAALNATTAAGHTPVTGSTYWLQVPSAEWTVCQYLAQINYSSTRITYSFVYTLVNDWGEEGPPSDPVPVDADFGQSISLHGYIDPTTNHYQDYRKGALGYRFRFYGFAADSTGSGEYRLIHESDELGDNSVHSFGYLVTSNQASWGEVLPSIEYALPPPSPKAIAAGPNGMIGCITDDYFAVCEPDRAWAWPEAFRKAIPYKTVGLLAIPGGWLITTVRYAYVVAGPIPEQLSLTQLQVEQAGISQKSMCTLGEAGAAYASHDGIVIVQGLGASLASGTLFSRKEWRDRYAALLTKMRLAYHDGKLVCLFPGTAQSEASDYQGFVIRFDEGTPVYSRLSVTGSAVVIDQKNDQLLIGGGTGFKEFETGDPLPLTWQSKEFILPRPENLGAMLVEYTGGPLGIDTHVNGQTVNLQHGSLGGAISIVLPYSATRRAVRFRLPGGFKSDRYSFYLYDAGFTVPAFGADATYTYDVGQRVLFGGVVYLCIQASEGQIHAPDVSPSYWSAVGAPAAVAQIVHRIVVASTMAELNG